MKTRILSFTKNQKDYPVIAAIASGLYPLIHYYSFNLTIANSYIQFFFILVIFIAAPLVIVTTVFFSLKKVFNLSKRKKAILLSILNFGLFAFFSAFVVFGLNEKRIAVLVFFAVVSAFFIYKYYKKIIVVQFILALLSLIVFIPNLMTFLMQSNKWLEQPDNISEILFEEKPNIYYIQSDGYANFSELNSGHYNYNNSNFEDHLKQLDYTFYPGFRSNYYSTLSSNMSLFSMKHHYYFNTKSRISEIFNARSIIIGENSVNSILKNNGYKLFLFLENTYLLTNRPKSFYDYVNIDENRISILGQHEDDKNIEIIDDLKSKILKNKNANNFYFIEKMSPKHIGWSWIDKTIEAQRDYYVKRIEETNLWLKDILTFINMNDPNALVILSSDHGGYVGLKGYSEVFERQKDPDKIKSIYSAALAIKWPIKTRRFDAHLKSSVNLFRVIFSVLSQKKTYLNNLQDDSSYSIIRKGASNGVYKYINNSGDVVFEKYVP